MAPRLFPLLVLGLLACSTDNTVSKVNRQLTVSPELLDFGTLPLGASATKEVSLAWTAGSSIDVVSAEIRDIDGSGFTTDFAPVTVDVGATETVNVTYNPTEIGWQYSQLLIYTNEEEDSVHTLDLRGHAGTSTLTITPALVDFGPVDAGATGTEYVRITNTGDVDVSLDSAEFDDATIFSSPYSLPESIAASAYFDFPMTAAPADDDPTFGTVKLNFTGAETMSLDLRVNACVDGDPTLYDEDGDGWSSCASDCDDHDAYSNPGGTELCDGVDEDCDGVIDNGTECFDDDGDGFTEEDGDCVDSDSTISPAAYEDVTNGIDDNCDGIVDLGTNDPDGDGFSEAAGDCEPFEPTIYPGAVETADGADNDCDGTVDEGTDVYDDDGDGYTERDGDCDDTDSAVHPGASETANGVDDNCDGVLDEGTDWGDDDGDGWSERGGDCDDGDKNVNPGALEVTGDGIDNDCDGSAK